MRYLVRIACFICCVGIPVSAQQNKEPPVNPWNITEISAFHKLLHGMPLTTDEKENGRILINASAELETAFDRLQRVSLPGKQAAAYAVFVDSVRAVLVQFRKVKKTGDNEKLRAAFDAIDETFELAVPRLRRMLNGN